jgi:ribosomal protein S6
VGILEELRNQITNKGGLIIAEGRLQKQKLAYPIKKESEAFFHWLRFSLDKKGIVEIKGSLEKNNSILRFLMMKVKKEAATKRPKIIEKKKEKKPELAPETEEPIKSKEEEIDKKLEELLGK